MMGYPLLETGCLLSIMAILPPQSSADELKLVNGDQLSGTVIAVDKDKVTFNNSVLGKITILRSKVAATERAANQTFLVMEPPGSHRARPARPGSIPIAYAARCPCRRGHARARARRGSGPPPTRSRR